MELLPLRTYHRPRLLRAGQVGEPVLPPLCSTIRLGRTPHFALEGDPREEILPLTVLPPPATRGGSLGRRVLFQNEPDLTSPAARGPSGSPCLVLVTGNSYPVMRLPSPPRAAKLGTLALLLFCSVPLKVACVVLTTRL